MFYILIILLSIELILVFLFNGRKIISPSFISVFLFWVSSIFYALAYRDYYGVDIHAITVFAIVVLLPFIFFGEIVANLIRTQSIAKSHTRTIFKAPIKINIYLVLLLFAFVLLISVWYVLDIYKFSLTLGNSAGNYFGATQYVRHATNYGDGLKVYSSGTILSHGILVSKCIVYLSIFAFVDNFLLKRKKSFLYLMPCTGYLLYILFCDSRGYLILDILIILMIILDRMKERSFSLKKQAKTFAILAIVFFAVFILAFRLLGFRTGTSDNFSFFINIADYVSSGILGLDVALTGGLTSNQYFGQSVFSNIYIKLNDFGFNFKLGNPNGKFFTFLNGQSNIYTGLLPPIQDFGVFSSLFLFIWSFAVQSNFNKQAGSCRLLRCFILGLLFYPLAMISVGGEWSNVLSVTSLYQIVYLLIFEFIFFKKRDAVFCRNRIIKNGL